MNTSLKGKLIAGFILAFLAGGAAGAFFGFRQSRHGLAPFEHHPHSLTERMRSRMKTELDLTPQQLARIEPILDHATQELQKIRTDTGAKVRQVLAETNNALKPELTDAQRARLEKIGQPSGRDPKRLRNPSRRHRARGLGHDESTSGETPPPALHPQSSGEKNK